jgi:diguanylate cyclase (GGDEF)-like protein/PAS domain S-box-containing protein
MGAAMPFDLVEALGARISVLRRAQHWLHRYGRAQQADLLNALPAHVAVLDSQGAIISVNKAWRQFDTAEPSHCPGLEVGTNYAEVCESASTTDMSDARQIAVGVRAVLAGTAAVFARDYACGVLKNARWFALTVTPLEDDGSTRGAIVMHRDITAERNIEETLRDSETRLRQITENMRDAFFLADAVSHHILYISPAFEAIWGENCASLYANPMPWTAGVHPDDRAFVQQTYAAGVLAGTFDYECRILRPDRAVRWIRVRGSPVRDAGGRLVRVTGAVEDITQRKHSLQALHDSRQRLTSLVTSATDAILTIDEHSRVVLSNPAAETMFGYTTAELRGLSLERLVPECGPASDVLDIAGTENPVVGDRTKRPDGPVTGLRKSGETFQIESSLSTFDADGRRYFTTMLRDLTEGQRAANQLRECQRRLSDLLSTVELMALMLDRSARIVYCNDYFLKVTGWRREEVLGENFIENFVAPEHHEEIKQIYVSMLANLPHSRHHETTILTRSGEARLIRWNNSVLRSISGEVIGITRIGEDVTERQRSDVRIKRLSRVYEVLSETNALLVRVRDREELFAEACRIAVDAGTFKMAWIGLLDSRTSEGKVVARCGGKEEYVSRTKLSVRADSLVCEQPASRALRLSEPVICNDISTDPSIASFQEELLEYGYKSLACFPLMVAGRAAAVLVLYSGEPNAFDEGETRLLLELAGNISFALDHLGKQERLDYLGYYDELTGLANRSLFLERVAQFIRGTTANRCELAVGIFDLERFKSINQSLGRASGDALLRQVAGWLTNAVGDATFLARIGADHFAIVFPEVKLERDLGRLIEQTMEDFLRHPFRLNDAVFHIGAKIGMALYPDDGVEADMLFRNAEAALRKAKMAGDRYLFYTQKMTETVVGRLNLENQLRDALDKQEFVLYYQPKMNLLSGKVTGAEALIRWNDPRSGLVLPGKFISVLEETGLIHEVGRWALHQAVEDYLYWRTLGLCVVRISVNVSSLQLRSLGFVDELKQVVTIDANAASGLELEITESVIMEDVRHSGETLQNVRALGVTVAIDDFGTGFSSLSYLSRLPVDTLKIDRSFVQDMAAGQQGTILVSAIINLAHSLKLNVVAEGVETAEQSALLRSMHCDELQGYLYGRPAPRELFESKFLVSAEFEAPIVEFDSPILIST